MVLGPVTAVGIAANVVQFLDFAFKLISNGVELYRNSTLLEHAQLRDHARHLQDFNNILTHRLIDLKEYERQEEALSANRESLCLNAEDETGYEDTPGEDEVSRVSHRHLKPLVKLLRIAIEHCNACAAQVLATVAKLTTTESRAKWQSFRHALSSCLGDSGLAVANKRLSEAQQNVTMFLILYTSSYPTDTSSIMRSNHVTEKFILQAVEKSTTGLSQQIRMLKKAAQNSNRSISNDVALDARNAQPDLFHRVTEGVTEILPHIARERFLGSLHFDSINDRHHSITKAHRKTLQWVLTPDSHQEVSWSDLPSWLESDTVANNIYWIAGKPGSGKSTLYALPCRLRTNENLPTALDQITACPDPQKSMEGLLRTLLYQALSDQDVGDEIFQEVAPERWHGFMYGFGDIESWAVSDLTLTFRKAVSILSQHSKFMLFVDGLDEFGVDRAEREDLMKLFLSMLDLSNVKMCLSSRPWNVFKDTFGHFPGLRLEELTRQDMRDFVQAELGSSRAIQDIANVAPDEVIDMQEQLVTKSDGVFLWLHLVTKRMKMAAQDGKSLRKLVEMLNEFPPDLEDFFQRMLRRIPERDQVQTSKIFQIMLGYRFGGLPTLMTMSFTDEDVLDFAMIDAVKAETSPQIRSRVIAFKRRLDSQCMDLLICASEDQTSDCIWETTGIEYLHRTVKDFLETKASQEVLLTYTSGSFDTSRYSRNAFLAQMIFMNKFIPTSEDLDTQIYLFEMCIRRALHIYGNNILLAKPFFESAVDELDSMLDHKPQLDPTAPLPSVSGNMAPSWTRRRIYEAYESSRQSMDHTYLLMAALSGFNEYFRIYYQQVPERSDRFMHLLNVTKGAVATWSLINLELFRILLERARAVKEIFAAVKLLRDLYDLQENESRETTHGAHQVSSVAARAISLEESIRSREQASLDVFIVRATEMIHHVYEPQVAKELVVKLQGVCQRSKPAPHATPPRTAKSLRGASKLRTMFSRNARRGSLSST